jgi:hypothetical protein
VGNEPRQVDSLEGLITNYVAAARADLASRWTAWQVDIAAPRKDQVLGALLARQVTLATQLAGSPGVWNQHAAPLFFRAMVDLHITAAWILKDPEERSRTFLLHGLGQEKLYLEHRRNEILESGEKPEDDEQLSLLEDWIDEQQHAHLLEVNVGSWSGLDVRTMADETGLLRLYRLAYAPWSASAHSMWNHIGKFNVVPCRNPLHRFHRVPAVPHLPTDVGCLVQAAGLLQDTFALFDEHRGGAFSGPSAVATLHADISVLAEMDEPTSR